MAIRKKRAIGIFNKAKEKSHRLKEQLTYAEKFCNYLLVRTHFHTTVERVVSSSSAIDRAQEISDANVPKSANTWLLSKSSLQAPEMKPMQLIVPLQTQLTATLPAGDRIDHSYNPFPETQVFVHELQDKVRALFHKPRVIWWYSTHTRCACADRNHGIAAATEEDHDGGQRRTGVSVPVQTQGRSQEGLPHDGVQHHDQ